MSEKLGEYHDRPITFIRKPIACKELNMPLGTMNELIAKGLMPQPVRIGARAVAFIRDELEAWKKARIAERDNSTSN